MKYYSTFAINERMKAEKPFSDFVSDSVGCFLRGDFGSISAHDWAVNKIDPVYQMGSYIYHDIVKIWIIKDGDYLTVLFPNEY